MKPKRNAALTAAPFAGLAAVWTLTLFLGTDSFVTEIIEGFPLIALGAWAGATQRPRIERTLRHENPSYRRSGRFALATALFATVAMVAVNGSGLV